jgi:hypothetical protein
VGFPETPDTDVEYMKRELTSLREMMKYMNGRLDGQAEGINALGKNMQWIVDNVQGIFQMFGSPQFMSQMTNMMMGAGLNAGQAGPDAGPGDGPDAA